MEMDLTFEREALRRSLQEALTLLDKATTTEGDEQTANDLLASVSLMLLMEIQGKAYIDKVKDLIERMKTNGEDS